jgi:S-DNA-T family DNA segregation ATPase FtsK/SpoIIIE
MALVMFLITGNALWAAMPLAGALAAIVPLLARRHKPPWFQAIIGFDPAAEGPLIGSSPVDLLGAAGPTASLARRMIAETLRRAGPPPALAVPPDTAWRWARFAPPVGPAGPALTVETVEGGLRLTPGASWPVPDEGKRAGQSLARGVPGDRSRAPDQWIVRDAGLGLIAVRSPATGEPFRAAALGTATMEDLMRKWAGAAQVSTPPASIPLEREAIISNWSAGELPPIGLTDQAVAISLDLSVDGPHALVAGTSGSGKSEFLRALMLSECLTNPPDRLIIVGLDHKGGATFRDLEHLPQVVGVATDLDSAGTARVLTSLEAELSGRERLLERHAVAAWGELPTAVRPPRLLVVVDEFRTLLDALPEAAARLERLAAQGRSLGMGLVLATQRPAGAVSAQLRANLALRVCFRVATEADSLDVLGSTDAAQIDPAKPGSCIVSSAGRPPTRLRVRLLPPPPRRPARAVEWPSRWLPPSPAATDPRELVAAVVEAASLVGATAPPAPWLAPLPARLGIRALGWPGPGPAVILGLADLPGSQRQEPLAWTPSSGHLAVLGPPRSGRTTAAVTASAGLAAIGWPTHVISHQPAAFTGLVGLPGFGSLVDARDGERVCELLGCLGRGRLALVLDAASELDSLVTASDGRPLIDSLVQGAIAPGAALVVTAPAKPVRWLSLCGQRLVLPVADLTDALTLGLPRELAGCERTPGRVRSLGSGAPVMAQLALPPSASELEALVSQSIPDFALTAGTSARRIGGAGAGTGGSGDVNGGAGTGGGGAGVGTGGGAETGLAEPPERVLPLPERVSGDDLPPDGAGQVWVGLGGAYGLPLALPIRPGQPLAVVGPAGSGRSTALATLHRRLTAAGHSAVWFNAGRTRRWEEVTGALGAGQVAIVDDLESVSGPAPNALPSTGTLIAACTTATAAAFRPPSQLFHNSPAGLLLWPTRRGSATAFGPGANPRPALDLTGRTAAEPPGRGRLVLGGKSHPIQVAT